MPVRLAAPRPRRATPGHRRRGGDVVVRCELASIRRTSFVKDPGFGSWTSRIRTIEYRSVSESEIWYHPAMVSDIRSAELVRDALASLYDPHALAAAPLTSEFMSRGLIRSPTGLFDRLIGAIEQMKP